MYKCEICKKSVPPSTPATRLVVKTRKTGYPLRKDAHKYKKGRRDDLGGVGTEIVREILACPQCSKNHN
ncbi:MAG: hypothetical protein GY795_23095 [Desulfobacterales bacterium]|nr:hypothetical protein [Desulfobacterales bacterium]